MTDPRYDFGPFVREEDGDGLDDEDRGMQMLAYVIAAILVVAIGFVGWRIWWSA